MSVAKLSLVVVVSAFVSATQSLGAQQNDAARESVHPTSIALWSQGAPGSEGRKAEPEMVDWRDEPENSIRFPIVFNVHNPSITPFLP